MTEQVKPEVKAKKPVTAKLPNLAPMTYTSKLSLEAATTEVAIPEPKKREEYVKAFKSGVEKTARSTLEMCRVVYEASVSLDGFQFGEFCKDIGFKDYSSTVRKYIAIGKLYPRFIQYADMLPASWTNIYLITQIPAEAFEECIKEKFPLYKLTGSKLDELVKSTKDINVIDASLTFNKKESGYVFGKLLFTKRIDDVDWRAMEKALNELSARLPIKFVVNKEVAEIIQKRKDQRYEKSKQHHKNIELKPDLWDMGAEANAVFKVAERTQAANDKAAITA
jgi:hypothetical protein